MGRAYLPLPKRWGFSPVGRRGYPEEPVGVQGHKGTGVNNDQVIVPNQDNLPQEVPISPEGASTAQGYNGIIASKGRNNTDQLGDNDLRRNVSSLSKVLQDQLQSLGGTMLQGVNSSKSKIQKVHTRLRKRQNFEKYYNPVVLAFGPIHHEDSELKKAERLKLILAAHFIKKNKVNEEELCRKILTKIDDLKECYAADLLDDDHNSKLAYTFLVDGCAVLCFIQCLVDRDEDGKKIFFRYDELEALQIKIDTVPFILRDLFLLENQLPYQLLLLICSIISDRERLIFSIKLLVAERAGAETPPNERHFRGEPSHLLDLLRDFLTVEPRKSHEVSNNSHIILDILDWEVSNHYTFRNVTELKASGVGFKRSETNSLKAISFDRGWFLGDVKLPLLRISNDSAPLFLNLIAYEMCPDFKNDYEVTSYICFLDSLIDQPEDVAVLRKAHILHNLFGSDEEVSKLFNVIGTELVPNPMIYLDVKRQIDGVYQNKWKVWFAQLLNDYFSSPWTALAFVGALVAITLTFVQTWYAINPKK